MVYIINYVTFWKTKNSKIQNKANFDLKMVIFSDISDEELI